MPNQLKKVEKRPSISRIAFYPSGHFWPFLAFSGQFSKLNPTSLINFLMVANHFQVIYMYKNSEKN